MTHGPESLRPLRDGSPSDPDLALGARLLVHAPPLTKSESRKRRVWNALSTGRSSRLGFRFTALHVALASVLFAAVSSAAVGGYYVKYRAPQAAEAETGPQPSAAHGKPRTASKARTTHPKPVATEPLVVAASPEADQATVTRAAPARVVTPRRVTAASEADAELLVEAMRARRSGDARRVSQLVDEYRARHPQGALQEEALILSVESAVARHAANAPALAREYLRRFPGGRFAPQAQRALETAPR